MIRNTRSGEAVVFRIHLKNEDLARVVALLGGHPSEQQIMRWSQQVLVAALDLADIPLAPICYICGVQQTKEHARLPHTKYGLANP